MSPCTDNVFLVSRRWSHHAEHSGYDLLARYAGQPLTAAAAHANLIPERVLWRLNRNMLGYDRPALVLELSAARHMATHRNCIYHFLCADNCYNYAGLLNGWRGHKIVATYHHPPSKLGVWVQSPQALARLSAVILVGSNQYSFFRRILPPERIACIPHPIDTSFFVPPNYFDAREDSLCLFVGSHLRDFGTLRSVIEDARLVAPQLKFVIVTHADDAAQFDHVAGHFTLRIGVRDRELLQLYQRATVLIQPLLDATANNAVLEALSCGLPMVVTDIGAIRDYVDERCARLVAPFRPDAMLEHILDLVKNRAARESMSVACRKQALTFDWHPISQRIRDLYAGLAEPRDGSARFSWAAGLT